MEIAIILVVVGIIIALAAVIALKREKGVYSNSEITVAKVVGYDKNHGPTIPILEFTVDADVVKLPLKDYTGDKLDIGEEIEVGYIISTVNNTQYYELINLDNDLPASKLVMTLSVVGAASILLGAGIAIMSALRI